MSDNLDQSQAPGEAGTPASSTRLQRRRVLLSALGKGGVVLGAAVPLASHAIPTLLTTNPGQNPNRLCTQSGVGSVVHSGIPVQDQKQCAGYSPSHYNTATAWPAGYPKGTTTVDALLGNGDMQLASAVLAGAISSDLAYWIAAALNAVNTTIPAMVGFPYSLAEVRSQFAASGGNPNLVLFYRTYLSSL